MKPSTIAGVLVCGLACGVAAGQDAPAAMSAAELAEALRAAGYELPEGFSVNSDGSVSLPAPEVEAPEAPAMAADVPSEPVQLERAPEWDNRIELALNLSEGNTEQTNFRAGYVGTRETERSKLSLDAAYFYGKDGDGTTENRATAGVNHDWLWPESKWIVFANGRADYDQFNSWRYRTSAFGGVGYKLIDTDKFKFTPRAGAGVTKEFGSTRNELIPEGLLGFDLLWEVSERQSFESTFRYYPSFLDFSEFRTVTTAGWRMDLDGVEDGLSLTAGLLHEYQSEVDPGQEESDLRIFAGLGLDF